MKLWTSIMLAAVMVCLSSYTASFGAGEIRNLALNRPCEFYPDRLPGTREPSHDYDGDALLLSDGYTDHQSRTMFTDVTAIDWQHGIDAPLVILFDLGGEATVTEVRVYTSGGGHAGITEPGLKVLTSLDNKAFFLASESPAPLPPEKREHRPVIKVAKLDNCRARYVAISLLPRRSPITNYRMVADEIEIMGTMPADEKSTLPPGRSIKASGAEEVQGILGEGIRAKNRFKNLTASLKTHRTVWPKPLAEAQEKEIAAFRKRIDSDGGSYRNVLEELTERQRLSARSVYGQDLIIWEVLPDAPFTMLSLPETWPVQRGASIDTVINAMECTALAVANLTEEHLDFQIDVIPPNASGAPLVTPRVGRVAISSNGFFIPDVLLATDSPQTIPSGESKVVWLIARSTDARAGLYDYKISVKVGSDRYLVPLRVEVHDVTLSKETPLSTGNWSYLSGSLERRSREIPIRDEMLDSRITAGVGHSMVPQKDEAGNVIRPARHDRKWLQHYLEFHKDFPLIGWFYPFSANMSRPQHEWFGPVEWMDETFKEIFRELITGIVRQIKASGRDYDGFYFQMFDETMSPKVVEICELVHSFDPNVQMLATVHRGSQEATKHFVEAGIKFFLHHAADLEYDNAPDGYPTLGSDGRQLWIYGAIDNTFGHGKERDPLIYYRYMHWSAYRHNVNGVWFWDMVNPNGRSNGWIDENESQVFHPMVYTTFNYGWQSGQGVPADVQTAEQVIPSRRWRYSRMGIEDYMLLKMAQESIETMGAAGNVYQKQLDAMIESVLKNRYDRKLFHRKRKELVRLVETLVSR